MYAAECIFKVKQLTVIGAELFNMIMFLWENADVKTNVQIYSTRLEHSGFSLRTFVFKEDVRELTDLIYNMG